MSFDRGVLELVSNKVVELLGIINTVLVKEAVNHAPTPRLYKLILVVGDFEPEVYQFLNCV